MKKFRSLMVMLLMLTSLSIVNAGNYDEYNPIWLNWEKPLKVVASSTIEQDGLYHIVFQAQAVNDTASFHVPDTIMVAGKLTINGEYIHGWTENIPTERHYAMVTIVQVVRLYVGDVVDINMRGDCSKPYPKRSVMVLTGLNKFQFDVVKIAD